MTAGQLAWRAMRTRAAATARTWQRARREEDKDERRRALLDAARALFEEQPYAQVKIADVAARAGLAKGTVFVYYASKESLFLALTEQLLAEWMAALAAELEGVRGRISAQRAARILAGSLAARPTLARLLAILGSVLEQEADVERIAQFKTKLVEGLADSGALLERKLGFLGEGGGAHLLVRCYALVVGLHALSEVSPNAAQAIASRAELASLRFDFERELESALGLLLRGIEAELRKAER